MGFGDDFKFYTYVSDDGQDYVVKLSSITATIGGFTEQTNPLAGTFYPYGPKNMRHVWGVSSAGKRARVPMAQADAELFVDGGTFSLHSVTYTVQGAIGEARKLSNLGG